MKKQLDLAAIIFLVFFGFCFKADADTSFFGPPAAVPAGCTAYTQSGWVQYNTGTWVMPFMAQYDANGNSIPNTQVVTGCAPNVTYYNYVSVDGKTVLADLSLTLSTISTTTTTPLYAMTVKVNAHVSGQYHIGLQVGSPSSITTLNTSTYNAPNVSNNYVTGTPTTAFIRHHYPYDWSTQQPLAAHITVDMGMPGVFTNGNFFVEQSNELSTQDIHIAPNAVVAALSLTNIATGTGGADAGSNETNLDAGQSASLEVLVSAGRGPIDDAKWGGAPTPMSGKRIAGAYFNPWGGVKDTLTQTDYTELAQKLKGKVDYVLIRTMDPDALAFIPGIFHQYGIKVIHYNYFGGARFLDGTNYGLPFCGTNYSSPSCVEPSWQLYETPPPSASATQNLYTAPSTIEADGASWQILNSRLPQVQEWFINNAVFDMQHQWDGEYYDNPIFWLDNNGWVGGDRSKGCATYAETALSSNCPSLSYASANILVNVRKIIRDLNPAATVWTLAQAQYVDQIHAADNVIREGVNFEWIPSWTYTSNQYKFTFNAPIVSQEEAIYTPYNDEFGWAATQTPYIKNNLFWGSKGANPLFPGSAVSWSTSTIAPSSTPLNFYTDINTFGSNNFDPSTDDPNDNYSTVLADAIQFWGSNTITSITNTIPQSTLAPAMQGIGLSLVRSINENIVSDSAPDIQPMQSTVQFSKPLPAFDLTTRTYMGSGSAFQLDPSCDGGANKNCKNDVYVFAERPGDSSCPQCRYSGEYMAWFNSTTYLIGNIRFTQSPSITDVTSGGIVAHWTKIFLYCNQIPFLEQYQEGLTGLPITTGQTTVDPLTSVPTGPLLTPLASQSLAGLVELWSPLTLPPSNVLVNGAKVKFNTDSTGVTRFTVPPTLPGSDSSTVEIDF